MPLTAQDRLVANLEQRRRQCQKRRRLQYMGVAALLCLAMALSYVDLYSDVDLIVPLGPFVLAVAISRLLWGMQAARVAAALAGIIAIGDLAKTIYDGEFAFWGYCLFATIVIVGRAA